MCVGVYAVIYVIYAIYVTMMKATSFLGYC